MTVVLIQFTPRFRIGWEKAARIAGGLLFALAGMIGLAALVALAGGAKTERSLRGLAITERSRGSSTGLQDLTRWCSKSRNVP